MAHIALCDEDARSDTAFGRSSTAEQRVHITQRLAELGEMTGGIAHDFRNILAVIEAGLNLAERNMEQPEKMRVYIAAARDGIDRGAKLTSQLLVFAKQPELGTHAGDVNELLKKLELFLKYGAGAGIQIVFDLAADLPNCVIDRSQFGTAVLNLVVNSRDAMPNGGEVQISTELCTVEAPTSRLSSPAAYVRVRVKDNGQGMPPEIVRKVFDPFFTTKGEKGTGLGLPHVAECMRRLGGHVSVNSEPGIGTIVDLFFPTVNPDGIARSPKFPC
jgi:signal transduction histidine kinase